MATTARNAILKAKIQDVITELMIKTNAANVYVDDTTTLATKLGTLASSTDLQTLQNAYNNLGDLASKDTVSKSDLETTLANLIDGKVSSVTAGDASVTVGGTATAPTVAVKISGASGNALSLETDGLKVTVPSAASYTVEKLGTASSGASASYILKKDGTQVGATIDIPKDMVVSSGTVVTKTEAGAWGAAGTYIELTIANATSDKLYINVANLIEYVTSGSSVGDMIVVAVSDDHQVTATITDGTITKAKLHTDVQTSLGKADSAVQPSDLTTLNNNSHTHTNKLVLDGISSDDVTAWDAKSNIYYTSTEPSGLTANDLWVQLV